jgi:drug/metabolite transporter (DMT)-like permease
MRSRSPTTNAARLAARKKYTYAAVFLAVSLVAFTAQTELAAYVQHDLGWDKAYCMLYLTHGSWVLLWPVQLGVLRLQKRDMPWPAFWRRHVWLLRTTALMVETQTLDPPPARGGRPGGPWRYMMRTTAGVTTALTVAGLSWYVAVNKTTPSDLTAIYNCSAFFAYAFSVPLLKEKLRLDKSVAVAIAIVGVLVVAYGDGASKTPAPQLPGDVPPGRRELDGGTRFLGNLIIGVGSVLYGLYEVLYKRYACPPEGTSAGRGMIFANAFGSLVGAFTLLVLWIPLPILHVLGWETFELPTGYTAWLLFLSVVMNATFAGCFLVLISLTSPVLSSVAALLTIFLVAIVDWMWTGQPLTAAAVVGGCLISAAFAMLSWSTWREMTEEGRKREVDIAQDDDDSDKDID